jgi:NTP pyrophosphatase (non-canonical NTP hydrolase)
MTSTENDKQGCWRKTYRDAVLRTAGSRDNKVMGVMGLCGEAGEVADVIKKQMFHGHPIDKAAMMKELGDVRWYLEYLADCYGLTMREIEEANMAKLAKRYPEGFSEERSINRTE